MRLQLYIAGNTPNSARAQDNLYQAMEKLSLPQETVEIIDVFQDPNRVRRQDDVFSLPSLVRIDTHGSHMLIGDLHDTEKLLSFLIPERT